MARLYNRRPSEILGIDNDYTAFCFDEACAYIICQMNNDKTPDYNYWKKEEKQQNFSSFKDFYKQFGG